jgi:hypothetical protein
MRGLLAAFDATLFCLGCAAAGYGAYYLDLWSLLGGVLVAVVGGRFLMKDVGLWRS